MTGGGEPTDTVCAIFSTTNGRGHGLPPARRGRHGSLAWAGLANLYRWIDRRDGFAGFWGTQVLPFADPASDGGYLEMETLAYEHALEKAIA